MKLAAKDGSILRKALVVARRVYVCPASCHTAGINKSNTNVNATQSDAGSDSDFPPPQWTVVTDAVPDFVALNQVSNYG